MMKISLKRLPRQVLAVVKAARAVAEEAGVCAYLVGGFVRDLHLGVANLDVDIVVEADGIAFAQHLGQRLHARLIRHSRFGTATLILPAGSKVDIATARRESYPSAASLPVVTPAGLRDDLARRDFTINAMAVAISGDAFGSLIDFFDGRADLTRKVIRVLHDASFIDDPTRILRAIRFEQRLGFRIEPHTRALLRQAVRRRMLAVVEPQRIRDELILILQEPLVLAAVRRLHQLAGFKFISPSLGYPAATRLLLRRIAGQIDWFNAHLSHRRQLDGWLIYLLGLLAPLSLAQVKKTCSRFVLRKGQEKRLRDCKMITAGTIRRLCRRAAASDIFFLLEPHSYETILFLKARYRHRLLQKHIADFFLCYNGTRLGMSGHDLARLGVSPGPDYQRIFRRLLAAKLDGRICHKEDELAEAKKLAGCV